MLSCCQSPKQRVNPEISMNQLLIHYVEFYETEKRFLSKYLRLCSTGEIYLNFSKEKKVQIGYPDKLL